MCRLVPVGLGSVALALVGFALPGLRPAGQARNVLHWLARVCPVSPAGLAPIEPADLELTCIGAAASGRLTGLTPVGLVRAEMRLRQRVAASIALIGFAVALPEGRGPAARAEGR